MIWVAASLVIVLLVVLVLYLGSTAGRLDRLHQRVDTSLLTLQTHLARRSALTLEVTALGMLDPATNAVLIACAHSTLQASEGTDLGAWQEAESEMTAALAAAFDEPLEDADGDREVLGELRQACRRVELSRRFHNDAVRACRQVRGRTLVRAFRLAGHTPLPTTWEMADEVPVGLG